MTDPLDDELGRQSKDGKPPFPGDNASDPECRKWLTWAFTVAAGFRIGDVTRYGGTSRTPMTIEIVPPGDGKPRTVRFEEERRRSQARDAAAGADPRCRAEGRG